jgi:hypothetical protein
MTVFIDFRELFAMIGGVVACGLPLLLVLVAYANFEIRRRPSGDGGGEKWK